MNCRVKNEKEPCPSYYELAPNISLHTFWVVRSYTLSRCRSLSLCLSLFVLSHPPSLIVTTLTSKFAINYQKYSTLQLFHYADIGLWPILNNRSTHLKCCMNTAPAVSRPFHWEYANFEWIYSCSLQHFHHPLRPLYLEGITCLIDSKNVVSCIRSILIGRYISNPFVKYHLIQLWT